MGRKPAVCTMGGAIIRRFALFPMMLLMLLLLPAGMVAQKAASSSKYIATYDSDTETLTFEKGESLSAYSVFVTDGMKVGNQFRLHITGIKHIVLDKSFETFSPTTLNNFFADLTKLETITGLEYLNTVNVTDMSFLFHNCEKLTSLDLSHFNTANVTNMSSMFDGCTGLTSLDVTKFNTTNVTNMRYMFSGCYKLKEIYISSKFVTDTVKSSEDMFWGCNSLSGDIDWTSDKAADKTYAKLDGGYFRDKAYDNRPWVKYADGTLTFRCGYKKIFGDNEYALNSGEEQPAWAQDNKANKVVFEASFANARPTTCFAWFKNFSLLNQIEGIENLNTENVTNMAQMFFGCHNLAELDVTHFNTANVTSMISMFNSCIGLTSLDVTNFNTENVTDMSYMFSYCNKLKEIYVSDKFVTGAVRSSEGMFYGASSLSGDIDWKSVKVNDKTYAKTDGGYFRDKAYDNRPWVKYADGTLTFRCGYKKTLCENEYLLNSGENLPAWNTQGYNITRVVFEASFANARPTTCYAWFKDFIFLQQIEGIENLNTANVTSMISMFCGCTGLTSLVVTNFNTENVTNMLSMFSGCSNLAGLDLTHFNTAKVTNMYGMFSGCKNLAELDLSNFNTDKVTNMKSMFINCSKLKEIYVSDKFVTDAVENSNAMFGSCSSLSGDIDWTSDKADDKTYAKIDGGYFRDKAYYNRPWVKYADGTLTFRCGYKKTLGENEYALNSGANLPKWNTHYDKINLVVFEDSFANARPTSCRAWFQAFINLKQIEGIENLNTENVTNMGNMFNGCLNLVELDVTHFNTAKVTNMNGMFNDCSGLTSLDVTHFNTAKVTNMGFMFSYCNNLKEIYVSDKFVTDAVTDSYCMFNGCSSLSGDIDWTSDKVVDKTYAKTDGGYFRDKAYDNRPWVKFADGTLTFRCGYKKTLGDKEYALNSGEEMPAWNTSINNIPRVVFDASFANARPTTCFAWFKDFTNLTQIEGIENLNTANVTSMRSMFCCTGLTSLDVTNFNTANVTDMNSMFSVCRNLAELDLSNFNTANVKDMRSMFSECKNLAELDLSNFNTAKVMNMANMFSGCLNLTTIYVNDDFVITNKSYRLFSGCTKLKGAIDKYDANKTNSSFANYKTGYFTKLVGKNGDEKIGAAGETLTADTLTLADDKDFVAYEPFIAKAASYSRTMKEGWATLCLPFEVSLQNQNFRAFKLLSADEGTETVELEEIKTSIEAGTPVIIKMKDRETKLSFTVANKEIANEVKTAETANGNYQLQGLYTQKVFSKDTDNNCYIVKGEKLMNPAKLLEETTTKFVGSKPFRAYMVDKSSVPVAGARMFSIRIGDGTTAIKQLEADAADTADGKAEYYDLQGHRLQDLQKGVNIVKRGGKTMKVVIK